MFRHALGFLLQFLLAADLYAAAILQTIEVKQQAGKVSLYFKLNQSVPHRAFTLTNPDRIVVDFEHTQLGFDLKKVTNANEVLLTVSYDPKLLGGFVLEYNSVALDASLLNEFGLLFDEI